MQFELGHIPYRIIYTNHWFINGGENQRMGAVPDFLPENIDRGALSAIPRTCIPGTCTSFLEGKRFAHYDRESDFPAKFESACER